MREKLWDFCSDLLFQGFAGGTLRLLRMEVVEEDVLTQRERERENNMKKKNEEKKEREREREQKAWFEKIINN